MGTHPADVLGNGAEVGVVPDGDGRAEAEGRHERVADHLPQRHVLPPEVGGEADPSVDVVDDARNPDAHAHPAGVDRRVPEGLTDEADHVAHGSLGRVARAPVPLLLAPEHDSAEADERDHRALDAQVEGDDDRGLRSRLHLQ